MRTRLAQRLVADFWNRVGSEEPFPRQLERSIMSTSPVFIVKVHGQRLDTSYIRNRLQNRGVHLATPWAQRRLNGCLVAFKGEAAIFVDGTLPVDESRVIIAHEFGHYLADYEWPRLNAVRHLGNSIVEVLDGIRPPTNNELIAAALADVRIGVYAHYMDRSGNLDAAFLVGQVEETASIIGAELLAPRHIVLAETANLATDHDRATIERILEKRFGLPKSYARWYAEQLAFQIGKRRSFSEILGVGNRNS